MPVLSWSFKRLLRSQARTHLGGVSARDRWLLSVFSSSSSMALQPGVGLGLNSNTPPNISIPCSTSPFVYSHLSQVCRQVIQPSHFWSSSASCCIQLTDISQSPNNVYFRLSTSINSWYCRSMAMTLEPCYRSRRLQLRRWISYKGEQSMVMGGSAFRPQIQIAVRSINAKYWPHMPTSLYISISFIFFYNLQSKGGVFIQSGRQKALLRRYSAQPVIAILYAAGWHTCMSFFEYPDRMSDCFPLFRVIWHQYLKYCRTNAFIGSRCPDSDSVVFGDPLTMTHKIKQKNRG
jgi:hypothetical protein